MEVQKIISIFLIPFLSTSALFAAESRSRVEELFIWKISDEMKLSVPEEKSFSELIRKLNQKKTKSNEEIQNVLKKLSKATSIKEKEKLLAEHRKLVQELNSSALEEIDQIQKLFGTDRASQYFVLKNDLTLRLKNLLAIPEKSNGTVSGENKLAPPQILEQK